MFNCFKKDQIKQIKTQQQNKTKKQLKILAVSDTHGVYHKHWLDYTGDVYIHAGDFTYYGQTTDFDHFFHYLDALKFKHKIVISGNHQIILDNGNIKPQLKNAYNDQYPCKYTKQQVIRQIKKRAIYLEHQFVQIQGLRIFGSPYTPFYCGSSFQFKKQYAQIIWNQIPQNLDILITHGPPYKILDQNSKKIHAGCPILRQRVRKVKPKVHIFGHIHQAHGIQKIQETLFMNVAYKHLIVTFI